MSMKKLLSTILIFAAVFTVPFLVLPELKAGASETETTAATSATVVTSALEDAAGKYTLPKTVKVLKGDEVVEYGLEDLVAAIVAAEMPAL